MGRWIVTLALLAGCFVLTEWFPFSPFFRNMDTMIHEFGHAAVTLLLSGEVQYIHLYEDHSGVTLSAVQSGWRFIPIALSGYLFASLFSVFLFALHHKKQARFGLIVITAIAVASFLLFVRNDFGLRWLLGFILLNVVVVLLPMDWLRRGYFLLLAVLALIESVMGAVTVAALSWTEPAKAGDAANLAEITGVPAMFWGGFFLLAAMLCARQSVGYLLPKKGTAWFSKSGIPSSR